MLGPNIGLKKLTTFLSGGERIMLAPKIGIKSYQLRVGQRK